MRNTKVIVPILCVLVGLGAGFFGGVEYKNYQLKQMRGNFGSNITGGQRFIGRAGQNGGQGGTAGGNQAFRGGGVDGSIISMDDKSLTVKMPDGSTKIVLFSDSTKYSNTIDAARSDLKVGDNIAVFGTSNSDGSVTAETVQLNPQIFRMQASPAPTK